MINRFMAVGLTIATLLPLNLNAQRTEQLLLSNWLFTQNPDGVTGVKNVTIPHDWAISGPFDKNIDKQVVAIEQNGEKEPTEKTGRSGSLPWIGEGTYTTTINIPEGYSHAELIFDGAMSEPRVYLDGKEIGYWAYGYNTFRLDISDNLPRDRSTEGFILPGKHELKVHLQNIEESSRWYPGAGLYRPVHLQLSQSTGFKTWGIFARTTRIDNISDNGTTAEEARLTITSEIRTNGGRRKFSVIHKLFDSSGKEAYSKKNEVGALNECTTILSLKNVSLWSPETPYLYTLVTELYEGEKLWDSQSSKIGIRQTEYSQDGFKLNGKLRKFKGVCLHHDLGPLGAAFNKAAFRRQVKLLKDIGCDAIRTSHNMPAPWQMDICDEMGMLVMAESCDMWISRKCKNGYAKFFKEWWEKDFTNLILVHRNHPSIVMWSIGNEIPEQGSNDGLKYTKAIQELIHKLDPTRPCTQGMDRCESAINSGVFQATEIPGFNYRVHKYLKGRENSPKGILLGSETASTVSSRGVYKFPVVENHGEAYEDGQISSYDIESCSWSNLPDDDWMWQDKAPWVIGEFVWTGFDYLGEPTPYDEYWPSRSSYFGIFDLAGLPKDRAYLYRTHWAPDKNTLHVLPHWNWENRIGEITPVFCYTNYPEAELFVNGKSQGRKRHIDMDLDTYSSNFVKEKNPWGDYSIFADPKAKEGKNRLDRYRMRWMDVRYEPGEIKVVAYDHNGNIAEEKIIKTAGLPDHIELIADRSELSHTPFIEEVNADGKKIKSASDCPDLSFVTARIVDKDGNLCPNADIQLKFDVKGKARFNSCCNGDATSLEVFTNPTMKAFHGEVVIVVEAGMETGNAVLFVSGKGLKTAKCNITIK